MSSSPAYKTLLIWCLLFSLMAFGIFIAWDLEVLSRILKGDVTRISAFILVVFCCASVHCAYRSWSLSRQEIMLKTLQASQSLTRPPFSEGQSHAQDYLLAVQPGASEQDKTVLSEVMAESLRGSHQVGWFIAGIVIKLGLLGTVVGFVIMLSSISGLDNLDTSDIKQLMQQMTQGMGVAMNTTMVGLLASMLLGIQYLLLDRTADRIVMETIRLSQQLTPNSSDAG